jgi:translation initiation factor 1 (eIF-1/SUI1)
MEHFLVEQSNNIFKEEKVTVFCEKIGRRCNTFVAGWNANDDDLKSALKTMTKKFGCGGAIKMITFEGVEDTKVLNLQGNFVVKTGEYLKSINVQNLIIKELVI